MDREHEVMNIVLTQDQQRQLLKQIRKHENLKLILGGGKIELNIKSCTTSMFTAETFKSRIEFLQVEQ